MKMRYFVIGMSIVMSAPVDAMRHHHVPRSYKAPLFIAGGVAATYGVLWFHDYCASFIKFFEPLESKLRDESKVYNWRLKEYQADKPIVPAPHTSPFDHRAVVDGRKQVLNSDPLLRELIDDFSFLPHNANETLEDALYEKIQSEKKELLEHIDELVKATSCFFNWYNIRKTYKHSCTQYLTPPNINTEELQPTDQTQWAVEDYTTIKEIMVNAARTNVYHLMIGKITHGRIARLYWQLLTRYYRLEKIERRLRVLVNVDLKNRTEAEWKQIKKDRKDREDIEDQVLSSWVYEKAIKPLRQWYAARFAS